MSIKIKQLESGLALLQWLEGLSGLGSIIYVKDGKLVITLPIEGTVVEGEGTDISDMATKTWVTEQLATLTGQSSIGTVTKEDIADIIKIVPLQTKGSEIATVQVGDSTVTLCCDLSALAAVISPTFLGFPTAPEQGSLSDDTAIATTSFVKKVLRLVTGFDVDRAITDNTAALLDELLRRYSRLSGTSTVLESIIEQLLVEIQSSTADPAKIQALILKVQELMAAQEEAEAMPMPAIQQLILKFRAAEPIEGVDFTALEKLLLRYAAAGSCDNSINSSVETMLVYDLTKQLCDDLKDNLESYLSTLANQRTDTRKDIEEYLDSVQDILAVIQRLLTAYRGLPTSTPAINAAAKDLTDALTADATEEELRAKALVLEELLRSYDFSSYGLTVNDKSLEASLVELEQRFTALYNRVLTAAEGSQYETDYKDFFELLQQYKASGDISVEVLLLLEKLAAALEQLGEGSTDPTVPTTIVQTINKLMPLLKKAGFSVDQLLTLLLSYRQHDGNDSDVTSLLSQLMTFLTDGDTNDGADTDTTARDLKDQLSKVIDDIRALQEELARRQQEELNKRTDTSSEDTILKTIKELSAAVNNDPKFYDTIMSLINTKLNSSGGTVTGDLSVTGNLGVTGSINGTATKAVSDINGKDIVDYVTDVSVTGTSLMVVKGNGDSQPYNLPVSGDGGAVVYNLVTETADGLARKEDYVKLKGIEEGANKYILPAATDTVAGGVMTGANITNINGKISVTKQNITDALGYTPVDEATTYTIFTGANSSTAGKAGIVPAPLKEYQNRYLKGDGTWSKILASEIEGLDSYVPGSGGSSGGGAIDLSDYLKTDIANNTYQPLHASLTSIAGLTTAADKMIYTTAANKYAVTGITAAARELLEQTSKAGMLTYLGVSGSSAVAAKTIRTDLSSTSAADFNSSDDITPGVTGTLSVAHGGTGKTSLAKVTGVGNALTADKLSDACTISLTGDVTGSVSFDGSKNVSIATSVSAADRSPAFANCTTAAGTAAKTVTISDFALVEGARITVNFKNGNTAKNPTLNVSGTGAKVISVEPGSTPFSNVFTADITGEKSLVANRIVDLTYTSGQWIVSRSSIWAHSLVSGILPNSYWGALVTTCYSLAIPGESRMYYGICTTAGNNAAKVVTCPEMTSAPVNGTTIMVHVRNGNSAMSPTFNVNSKGAFSLYGPGEIIKKIPSQANVWLVYCDTSTSSTSSGRWQLGRITFDHVTDGDIFTVNTAADTVAKVNTVNRARERTYVHTNGGTISVNFTVTNTAANPTLNINGFGAKAMYWPDGTRITKGELTKGIWHFVYKSDDSTAGYYATTQKSTAATSVSSVETATRLAASKTILTNLASTTAVGFNGTQNIEPGVKGVLPVTNGGTGATSLANITVGNATTAVKLKTAQTIALVGAVTGSVSFDGSKGVTMNTTIGNFSGKINGAVVPSNTAISGVTNMKKGCLNFGSPYGNLKLQWGIANFNGSNTYTDFTFPTAFTTACYSIMISSGDNVGANGTGSATSVNNTMVYTFLSGSITNTKVRICRKNLVSNTYTGDWVCVWAIGV